MIDLGALVTQTQQLKPLPPSVTRLASIVAHNDWQIGEVADLIALDQALTARLLGTANSAASASRTDIVQVKDAIMRLGSGTVLSLAMGSSVSTTLKQPIPAYGLSEGDLWKHSVASAIAAEESRAFCRPTVPAESFAAALLHDIGKLVLGRFLQADMIEVLDRMQHEDGLSLLDAEKRVLGVNHGELGGLVVQHWTLPETIGRAVTFHESPDEISEICCDVVSLADVVAKRIGSDSATEDANPSVAELPKTSDGVCKRLGLARDAMEKLTLKVESRLQEVLSLYQ